MLFDKFDFIGLSSTRDWMISFIERNLNILTSIIAKKYYLFLSFGEAAPIQGRFII